MTTKLKNYFPMIRERKEVLAEIRKSQTLQSQFDAWNAPKQEMFLDAEESSLLVMDIVVELEDGSIANLEVQKIGYLFPGQRSACYSADLLLRQYRRIRNETDASSGENGEIPVYPP